MEEYEKMYKFVCRICLKQNNGQNMVSLIDFTSDDGLSCFGKAVLAFASVDIKSNDVFPTSMCNDCLYCLKQAISFKLKCETSDKQLKTLANQCFSVTDIKTKIVESVMFHSYFSNKDLQAYSSSDIKREVKPKMIMKNIVGIGNLDMEVPGSQDSFSDNFPENFDETIPNPSYLDEKPIQSQEEPDVILDRIEKLIGSCSDLSPGVFKKTFNKQTFKRHKKYLRRQQMQLQSLDTFNCNICHRVLANKHSYEHHMQRHNGCRYVCEHCGKGFPVLTELQVHQVAVHGTGPYLQCRQCPYKAPRKFSLTEHERIHTGERPYTCEKCGLTFRRRFVWKKHLVYHNEKTIQCSLCPRKFYLRSEMLAHCNNVHERVYVYLCNKCGTTYAKAATVRRHLTEKHGVPREMQGKVIRINKGKGDFPD
ncbi:zinc finger protein 16-like [Leguminivora glycinivorella]|uniref:zinc finger protein 16-like n=1 Tax=Leguminivora glycinivorella TaxID=1035111 RepID=UPI00200EF11D|nr:zinc finger protein 16-like [Leguminivora glycinivorella]